MTTPSNLSRRTFLRVVGAGTASLVIGCFPYRPGASQSEDGPAAQPNAFVRIDPDGAVTVTVSKSDMGQGVRTTFAMIVAEELDADWTKVKVTNAQANPSLYGGQGTGGSSSTRTMYGKLRKAGAAARALLVSAAAQQWGVDPSSCQTQGGKVVHPATGRTLAYGALTKAASTMTAPQDAPLKGRADFKLIGRSTNRVDNLDVVTGRAVFGQDVKVDNAVYAVVARRPVLGASLKSYDDSATRKVPGVVDVLKIGSGVAVVASNTWAAIAGREALKVEWDMGPNSDVSTATILAGLKAAVGEHKTMPPGSKVVEATYDFPYLAHATMEPMNAVADVRDGQCTVWAPTQAPDGAQNAVSRILGIPQQQVTVHTTLIGGGFGRRFTAEFVEEAVEVSRQMKRPAKVLWTRDDDMRNDLYRPMSHHALKGAVDASGNPVGWSHQFINAGGGGPIGGYGGARIPYGIPGAGMANGGGASPVPTGPWRSVEHTQLIPTNEMFIDELAHAAGQDPFEFRRRNMSNDRLRKVMETAAQKGDWGKPLPQGWGRGIACFEGYGSCAAHVVELEVAGGQVKVHRVVCAVDPGLPINPRGVEAQMQGACIDGLSTALRAEVTVDKGGIVQQNWTDYEWFRMGDAPKIEVTVMESSETPGGMGEVGYPSVPPAVANAVFAATGKRVRKFPIRIAELV